MNHWRKNLLVQRLKGFGVHVYLHRWLSLQKKHKQFYCKLIVTDYDDDNEKGEESRDSRVTDDETTNVRTDDLEGDSMETRQKKSAPSDFVHSESEIDMEQEESSVHKHEVLPIVKPEAFPECIITNQGALELVDPLGSTDHDDGEPEPDILEVTNTSAQKSLKANLVLPRQQRDSSSLKKCTYCDFTRGSDSRAMDIHLMRFHYSELYFTEELRKASGLGLTIEVFQKLLCFSWQQFIRNVGGRGRGVRLCVLCEKKFDANSKDTRIRQHFILQHQEKLKEKLKAILEDISRGSKLYRYLPNK